MTCTPPKNVTVIVDTREKCPLIFPTNIELALCPDRIINVPVSIVRQTMSAGDYSIYIDGISHETTVLVERKGSALELANNLLPGSDSARQSRSFHRLSSSCTHPILLLEFPFTDLLRPSSNLPHQSVRSHVLHRLTVNCIQYHLTLLWVHKPTTVQSRRTLGTFLIHVMYAICSHPNISTPLMKGITHEVPANPIDINLSPDDLFRVF